MQFEKWFITDLQQPLEVHELKGILFTGDEDGNLIGFEVYNGSSAASLSGSCVGYIIRPDGVTVTENGTISGNRASIVLPAAAYYHEGAIDIVIKVTANDNRVAVGAVRGYVQRSTTNAYADPSPAVPIPSVEELLEIIGACEDATTAAETAAGALENMDAVATTLTAGSSATASVSTVDGHYRITFGIPRGNTGATGATGATGQTGAQGIQGIQGIQGDPASITSTITAYQVSTNGVDIPTGTWSSTIPNVPQGSFLWIRTTLTWNGGSTTTLYSVSRMGVDGSGSVSSVNSISPDGNGNVELPYDSVPTQDSVFPCTSGGVYSALQNKQQILTFDTVPTANSTNPVTSGGILTALGNYVPTTGGTMTGNLMMDIGAKLAVKASGINIATTPSSAANQDVAVGTDTNGNIISFMRSVQDTSGNTGVEFNARRTVGNTTYFNGVTFKIASDGTQTVDVSVPAEWRSAIGAVAKSGDTMTGNLVIDNGSNYKGINIKGASNAPTISFYNTGTRLTIDEYAAGSTGGERYLLPVPETRSSDAWYGILNTKEGVLAYRDQTVSVSVTANAFTAVSINEMLTAPTGYTYIGLSAITASTSGLRGGVFVMTNPNVNYLLIYSTTTGSGTVKIRAWYALASAAKDKT